LFKLPTLNSGVAVISYSMQLFKEKKLAVLEPHREAALKFCTTHQSNVRAQLIAVIFFFFELEQHLDAFKPKKREDIRKNLVKIRDEANL
jgi:beta-galactosidase beta subunit